MQEEQNKLRKSRQYDDDVIKVMENRLDLEEERFADNID
jgi:energy-converting hydrogenase A subunit M